MPRISSKVYKFIAKHYDLVMLLTVSLIIIVSKTPLIGSTPKLTRNATKQGPLFPKSSLVIDYASGDLQLANQENRQSDLLVVYFYAPWDSQSIKGSSVFRNASEAFVDDRVAFIAVNCWEPSGVCASRTHLTRFPTIAIYARGLNPVVYDGPLRADYLTAFVLKAFHPFSMIKSPADITNLFAKYDNIVAGYFNFSDSVNPPGFFQFYAVSMKLLSKDIASRHTVMAIVIGPEVIKTLNFTASGQIAILRHNNTTLRVTSNPPHKCSDIWQMLLQPGNLQAPKVTWLQPSKVKSRTLDSALSLGPAAILFLRHSPLTSLYHDVSKLRELAHIYLTCPPLTYSPNPLHLRSQRLSEQTSSRRWRQACEQWRSLLASLKPANQQSQFCAQQSCWSTAWSVASNRCSVCTPNPTQCPLHVEFNCQTMCRNTQAFMEPEPLPGSIKWRRLCSRSQRRVMQAEASRLWHLAEGLTAIKAKVVNTEPRESQVNRRCRHLEMVQRVREEKDEGSFEEEEGQIPEGLDDEVTAQHVQKTVGGLGCKTNRSLHFYAIDHGLYPALTQQLGVNMTSHGRRLTVVDWKNEAVFIMAKDFRYKHAAQFVSKFHANALTPIRKSEEQPPTPPPPESSSVILDLTAQSFEKIMKQNKEVIVMYYIPYCGFCTMFMHKYRTLAQYFSNQKSVIFTRINVADNDLPYHLRVEILPAIIFFPPAGSKRQPAVLNLSRHVTVSDLVSFVLHSSTSKLFIQAASRTCDSNCLMGNRVKLQEQLLKLESGKSISLQLIDTAIKRLDYLCMKLDGLNMFKKSVRDWADWFGWWKEKSTFSREFRLLIDFYNHRLALVKEYHQKIASVTRVLNILNVQWNSPEAVWREIIN